MLLIFSLLLLYLFGATEPSVFYPRSAGNSTGLDQTSDLEELLDSELVQAPRIADVLQHFQINGSGLDWISDYESNSSYLFHTFEEWAAAEHAILGYKANTFAYAFSQLIRNRTPTALRREMSSIHTLHRRLDKGHDIPEGIETDTQDGRHLSRAARFFCYNSGQWATHAAWSNPGFFTCDYSKKGVVHKDDNKFGVKTWTSQRFAEPSPGSKIYVIFYQFSGWLGKDEMGGICSMLTEKATNGFCKSFNQKARNRRDHPDHNKYVTQGGILRAYDSPSGTSKDKLGAMLWEFRADPNTCHGNGNPC
ncbi:MAG: hypothetical protein Q9227_003367 [Pyrenula ochraceoflavens]